MSFDKYNQVNNYCSGPGLYAWIGRHNNPTASKDVMLGIFRESKGYNYGIEQRLYITKEEAGWLVDELNRFINIDKGM